MEQIKIPAGYQSDLNRHDTQVAIKTVKDFFQQTLAQKLNLLRVSAPVFVSVFPKPDVFSSVSDSILFFSIKDIPVSVPADIFEPSLYPASAPPVSPPDMQDTTVDTASNIARQRFRLFPIHNLFLSSNCIGRPSPYFFSGAPGYFSFPAFPAYNPPADCRDTYENPCIMLHTHTHSKKLLFPSFRATHILLRGFGIFCTKMPCRTAAHER